METRSTKEKTDELCKVLINKIASKDGHLEFDEGEWDEIVSYFPDNKINSDCSWKLTDFLDRVSFFKYKQINKSSNSYLIEFKNPPKLCQNYLTPNGCSSDNKELEKCDDLHCCLHYLMGDCKFKSKCKYSHNLRDEHNQFILKKHLMHSFSKTVIANILNVTNFFESKRPLICKGYNSTGNNCKFGEQCSSLHICFYYIQNECIFGKNCKRSHNLVDASVREVLLKRNINPNQKPSKLMEDIKKALNSSAEKEEDSSNNCTTDEDYEQKSTEDESSDCPRICTFYLRGECLFGQNCSLVHQEKKLPYQWQYELVSDKGKWENFEANFEIEKSFCDCSKSINLPASEKDKPTIEINFEIMTVKFIYYKYLIFGLMPYVCKTIEGSVRRLSTDSQCNQSIEYDFLTYWKWFWRDDNLTWIEYSEYNGFPNSSKLEEEFENDSLTKIFKFSASPEILTYAYEIDFSTMTQKNLNTGKVRVILRRPDHFDEILHKPQSISKIILSNKSLQITLPNTWSLSSAKSNKEFELVLVDPKSAEFKEIQVLFQLTVKIPIKSIKRIQNSELWNFYYIKKQAIAKKKPGVNLTKRLFHGTKKEFIEAICHQGFDFRLSGTRTGHIFGEGSYFARDASYSRDYSNSRQIFVAEVAIGEYTKGVQGYRRPPQKGTSSLEMYDSCVNDPFNPTIFVIFDNHQAYPEYIIDY